MTGFWRRVNRFPPIACRLLARHRYGPPLTSEEIAAGSGLSPVQVEALAVTSTWHGIDIYTLQKYTTACGMDFTNSKQMRQKEDYLRKRPVKFTYLKRSPDWPYYRQLITKWAKICKR
jgi:hypothetical protein